MSKRRLITTFVIGKLAHVEHTLPAMREYASKCEADFLEVKWLHDDDGYFHNNPNYSCVEHLRYFGEQNYYDEVLMLDADVLPLPWAPVLFDLPGDLLCDADQAWPTKDARYRAWLSRNYPDSSEMTAEGPYFNAGVLLFRRDAAQKLDLRPPYPHDYANDQDLLNMRVGEAGLSVNWLGPEFNQRHVRKSPLSVLRANHILHFVGCKDEIPKYAKLIAEN